LTYGIWLELKAFFGIRVHDFQNCFSIPTKTAKGAKEVKEVKEEKKKI
jgi:hypothetical protein